MVGKNPRGASMRLLATFLLSVTLAHAQSIPQAGITEIDALFKRAVNEGTVPGVVAIVTSKDRILYHNAFGLRDIANGRPMQEDSIFRIASMTKPMTSAAIMLLKEQWKLNLDDPVAKYLPEFKGREVITNYNAVDGSFSTRKASG